MLGKKKDRYLTEAEKAERDERKSKFAQTRDKFKLGSHHKMERFGVISLIFVISFSLVMGGAFHSYREKAKVTLDGKAIYTEQFETSITQVTGTVAGVYCNEDQTKVYVLLKYDDPGSVSLNVNDYKVFISAFKEHLAKEPKGVFHVIGSTGYLGIELISNGGFKSQVMDIWVRIGNNIRKASVEESDLHKIDKSFTENDQFRVLINPGAKEVKHAEVLDNDNATIADIYKALVAVDQEDEMKGKLQESLNTMQVDFNKADEYRRRLIELNVRVPKLPSMMAGDSFEPVKDADGNETQNYDLKTTTIYPGGLMLDWRNMSVAKDGYFAHLSPPVTNNKEDAYNQLTSKSIIALEKQENKKPEEYENWEWAYSDGKPINNENGVDKHKTVQKNIQEYEQVVNKYLKEKEEYQTTLQWDLLLLEINSDNINLDAQVNADNENNIVVWQQVR